MRESLVLETAKERKARMSQRLLRRASETDEARRHQLARDRARRILRKSGRTRGTFISQRRLRDRARRAA